MPNNTFRQELISSIRHALDRSQDIGRANLGHAALMGRFRELVVSSLLKPILPQNIEIGTGKITDAFNNLSSQSDIILYDRTILPPILFDQSDGVFPLEACFYSIEVKSRLTAKDVASSVENAQKLSNLRPTPRDHTETFQPIAQGINDVLSVLFAFDSDLSNKSEIDRYKVLDPAANSSPAIAAICVVGRGYWWFYPREMENHRWIKHSPTGDFDEVIDFLAGIINTLPKLKAQKGFPRYGNYVINPREFGKE